MTDEEFLALDPRSAQAAVKGVSDDAERRRLQSLYYRVRGTPIEGLAAKRAARDFDPAYLQAAQSGDAPSVTAQITSGPPTSGMLEVGRFLFWVGIAVAIVSLLGLASGLRSLSDLQGHVLAIVAFEAASAAASLGAFMWMLGAIEQRLLEIRELIRAKSSA